MRFSRDIGNSVMFFQHPDLMRSLGVHNAVLTLLKNTFGTVDVSLSRRNRSRTSLTSLVKKDDVNVLFSVLCLL